MIRVPNNAYSEMTENLYLDYNATAPLHPDAIAAMQDAFHAPANPSSVHRHGRSARARLERARNQLASALSVRASDITFTSGGTEASNMVLAGYQHIITSEIEHDAVLAASPDAQRIRTSADGVVDLSHLKSLLEGVDAQAAPATLVSVMGANNETGAIQPIQEIAALCKEAGVHFHSDMVQLLGKKQLNLAQTGVDYASFSAHKIGGPAGVGAVYSAGALRPTPVIRGGGQEQGSRSGTENLIGIVGFGAAAEAVLKGYAHFAQLAQWRDMAEQKLRAEAPEIEVIASNADRLANTSALYLPFMRSEMAVMALDLAGFSISAGAACSSGKMKPSHVISAMGMADKAGHVIRISSGWNTQREEWMRLAEKLIEMYKSNRDRQAEAGR